jgi:hypothetical protein
LEKVLRTGPSGAHRAAPEHESPNKARAISRQQLKVLKVFEKRSTPDNPRGLFDRIVIDRSGQKDDSDSA